MSKQNIMKSSLKMYWDNGKSVVIDDILDGFIKENT